MLCQLYETGQMSGIISERDYVKKVALLGRVSKDTKIKDIFTQKRNLVKASPEDSIEEAMNKMMTKSIRHLPIVDDDKLVGIVSIKDLIKAVVEDRNQQIKDLSEMALGKSNY
jgi:CBS domain-containing protein